MIRIAVRKGLVFTEIAMSIIQAVYENGVFRPTAPINLPEGTIVSVEALEVPNVEAVHSARQCVYESLSRSYEGGNPTDAERHNEHQP